MLVRALSFLLLVISCVTAMPPREQKQIGFFSPPWGHGDFSESAEDSGSNPDYPDYSSFNSMIHGLQAKMTQMRQQLEDAMERFPMPTVPRVPFQPSDIGFDESKPTNSSSTTKVINGHKVTVNETTYKSDNGGSAVFHVRIVDISPHDEKDKSSESETPSAAMDVVETPAAPEQAKSEEGVSTEAPQETPTPSAENNEIPQTREGRLLTDWQHRPSPRRASALSRASDIFPQWPILPVLASKWRHIPKPDMEAELRGYQPDSDVEMVPWVPMKPIDLGSDLRVNQLMSEREQAGGLVMPDPDSEFVELQDGKLVPNIQSA